MPYWSDYDTSILMTGIIVLALAMIPGTGLKTTRRLVTGVSGVGAILVSLVTGNMQAFTYPSIVTVAPWIAAIFLVAFIIVALRGASAPPSGTAPGGSGVPAVTSDFTERLELSQDSEKQFVAVPGGPQASVAHPLGASGRFCMSCGAENIGTQYCENCGEQMQAKKRESQQESESRAAAKEWSEQGNQEAQRKDWLRAAASYRQAAQLDPLDPLYVAAEADMHVAMGRTEVAIPLLEKLTARHPRAIEFKEQLAVALLEDTVSRWTEEEGERYLVTLEQRSHTQTVIKRVKAIIPDDPALQARLDQVESWYEQGGTMRFSGQ